MSHCIFKESKPFSMHKIGQSFRICDALKIVDKIPPPLCVLQRWCWGCSSGSAWKTARTRLLCTSRTRCGSSPCRAARSSQTSSPGQTQSKAFFSALFVSQRGHVMVEMKMTRLQYKKRKRFISSDNLHGSRFVNLCVASPTKNASPKASANCASSSTACWTPTAFQWTASSISSSLSR